jgi:ribosome production factor 1
MGFTKPDLPAKAALGYKSANKDRRKKFHIDQKQARDSAKRQERFERKREEDKNPELREQRRARNKPHTQDAKRKWDELEGEDAVPELGMAIDLEQFSKRSRLAEVPALDEKDSDADSMLEDSEAEVSDSDSEVEDSEVLEEAKIPDLEEGDDFEAFSDDDEINDENGRIAEREDSQAPSLVTSVAPSIPVSTTSTRLDLTPESLIAKFPTLFNPSTEPKVLITTSLNSTLHNQARLLATMFPNCTYVRRTAHRFAHKYSVREISQFASNRGYTTLLVLMEDQKKPCGLDIVHLPVGPHFHFSITNWVEGRKLPGHGNPTDHNPELILHNFKTPLGMLSAALFQSVFPAHPELQGRQVITLHNQRDYIFVRRHRYVFRNKRATEKSVVDNEGKAIKGVEDIRAGLQELGPRFTLKLRRVDKGIQRASGQEWKWKGRTDKVRTKFQM